MAGELPMIVVNNYFALEIQKQLFYREPGGSKWFMEGILSLLMLTIKVFSEEFSKVFGQSGFFPGNNQSLCF